jgi:hypothetical protein
LSQITTAALTAQGCAGWSVCIYNSDLDPDRRGAGNIITYLTHAITSPERRWPQPPLRGTRVPPTAWFRDGAASESPGWPGLCRR